jgi:hypothetical protein
MRREAFCVEHQDAQSFEVKGLESFADDRPVICRAFRVNRYTRHFDREAEADG